MIREMETLIPGRWFDYYLRAVMLWKIDFHVFLVASFQWLVDSICQLGYFGSLELEERPLGPTMVMARTAEVPCTSTSWRIFSFLLDSSI